MPTLALPGGSSPASTGYYWLDAGTIKSFFVVPPLRPASNGYQAMKTFSMDLYIRGRGADRVASAYLGGLYGTEFTLPSAGSAQLYNFPISMFLFAGDNPDYGAYTNGARYGGHGPSGGNSVQLNGVTQELGRALAGTLWYAVVPAAPTPLDPDQITTSSARYRFNASTDDGGSPATGHVVQRATNAAFTTGVVTIASSGTSTLTGLLPGTTYYVRSATRNAVSDGIAGGVYGTWSAVKSFRTLDGVRVYNHDTDAWQSAEMRVSTGGAYNPVATLWSDGDPYAPAS